MFTKMSTLIKIIGLGFGCLLLSACLNTGHLSKKQVKMLQKQGFELKDEGWTLGLPERLLFKTNESDLNPKYINQIEDLANHLKKYKIQQAKIAGYTDDIGSKEYNLKLSQKRADNVAQVFINIGYLPQNLIVIGRGMEHPLVPNDSDENRAINRRVSIIIAP